MKLNSQELPEGWKVVAVKWLSRRYSGGTPDRNVSEYWNDGTIPWLNSGAVNQGTVREPSAFITEEGFANSSAKWISRGSLIMALAGQGKTKATVGYLDIDTTGNQSLAAIVPSGIEGRYLYWWLASQYRDIRNLSSQDGRDGLNLEMVGSIRCPVPNRETQRRIASFLDEKAAQIDALIEKKRALLDRLAEKRQAIITQVVSKGLNPAAPMKDSGIDWLGQIPAHWGIKKASWYFTVEKGKNSQQYTKEFCGAYPGEIPVYSGQTEDEGILGFTDHHVYDAGSRGCVFSTTVGAKAMTVKLIYGKFCLSQNCLILFPSTELSVKFAYYQLQVAFSYERGLIPSHMQPSFRVADFNGYRIAVPPGSEQEQIAEHIDRFEVDLDHQCSLLSLRG